MRVLLECCLQEKRWNPFYSAVAARLCLSKKSHGITLKFCLFDKLKARRGLSSVLPALSN